MRIGKNTWCMLGTLLLAVPFTAMMVVIIVVAMRQSQYDTLQVLNQSNNTLLRPTPSVWAGPRAVNSTTIGAHHTFDLPTNTLVTPNKTVEIPVCPISCVNIPVCRC